MLRITISCLVFCGSFAPISSGRQVMPALAGGMFFEIYFFAHISQSPTAVGRIQPKTITEGVKAKMVVSVAGLMVLFGEDTTKLNLPRDITQDTFRTPRDFVP